MTAQLSCDICVIGGGSAGLSVAAGAAQMGADTILIERGDMGGDCLNSGCVPSKSLLAAAKAAHAGAQAKDFGITYAAPGSISPPYRLMCRTLSTASHPTIPWSVSRALESGFCARAHSSSRRRSWPSAISAFTPAASSWQPARVP
ncbi:FAD-dependent oxidoreductase [Fodinicurvata halophila]|uniref:FAD-dependent oxidoreductase n=1 Tax=Fodinicurvata halophila TaxID=1419723 RepID=UPI00362BB7E3